LNFLPSQKKIAVAPAAEYQSHRLLFDMLSSGLAVAFVPHTPGQYDDLDGLIMLSENREMINRALEHGLACYQVHSSQPMPVSPSSAIRFTPSTSIHRAFRNHELVDPSVTDFSTVPESAETLAEVENKPVWSVDRTGRRESHHVGVRFPLLGSEDFFHTQFRGSRWFAMVPLLHFLRKVMGPDGWKLPEPRATFIIDDPNLHHRSYGYIDFQALAKHAATHNYHATVATIPLDTWYFNRDVAALFRSQKQRISMMMHGINHISEELARDYTEAEALELLAAGLRRIAAFEARSGVKVDRVMAAPHGAFAESVADPMLRLGYEAGCVSIGSLVHWNPSKNWSSDLGIPIAQNLGSHAFPVFHRTGTNEMDIRLAAFLGHPVVIATHHQDYISNFARIESLANMVNEISSPQWMPIENISRTNYVSSVDDSGILQVRPYTRRLTVPLPEGVVGLQLLASPFCGASPIYIRRPSQGDAQDFENTARLRCSVSNNVMKISFPPSDPVDYNKVDRMPLGLWPVARRLLAEGRDRSKPMLSFMSARY
jgi:hypothetical protein